jgi:Mn2+/Fe2+ NRAMP family transporter
MTWDRVHVAALIAILGTTISPYLFFWQASEEVEELEDGGAQGTSTPLDIGHLRYMRQDVLTGMASAVVVMFSIMVAAGATLGKQGVATIQTADQAAQALKPIAGQFASLLFTLGIVGTGLLAVPVLAGSTAYAIAEAFDQPEGLSNPFRGARGFYLIIGAAMLLGLVSNFAGLNPVRALYFSAILNGLAAPPLVLVMLLLPRSKATCGSWTGGRLSMTLMAITFLLMAGLPIVYLFLT